MKTQIIGGVATITAEKLDFDAMEKNFPNGVALKDKDGKDTYLAKAKSGAVAGMNAYGCTFNQKNAAGEALIQITLGAGESKEQFATKNADALKALSDNLAAVKAAVDARGKFLADTISSIEVG